MKKNLKEFLLRKATQKWLEENRTFYEDVCDLINQMMMFEMKYGTKVLYSFEKPYKQEDKGRDLSHPLQTN